jgi:hypothetical protein
MNRLSSKDVSRIKTYGDPDDRMLAILEILTQVDIVPDVGGLYTFVYSPKTPEIEYDQHPLVVVSDIFRWGFRGYNFHWKSPHNYTWLELVGNLHKVNKEELNTLIALNYQKFRINT